MKEITVVKLGGSVITDKLQPYTARPAVIRNLTLQLKKYSGPLFIAHGSGSFGHTSAQKYGGTHGYVSTFGIAKVARDVMEINKIIMDIFLEEKIPALSLRPLSMILAENGKSKKYFFAVVKELLYQGLIPVVYGDVIIDTTWKSTIFSGEKTLLAICKYLLQKEFSIKRIIEVGNTHGVYDDLHKTIFSITEKNWLEVKKYLHKTSDDVTGGMLHKVQNARIASKIGISTILINGNIPQELSRALDGKPINGTIII